MPADAPLPGASAPAPSAAPPPEAPTFAILASTPRETLAEIRFPEPALIPVEHAGRPSVRVSLAGCQEMKGVDEPSLPVRRWDLALPSDSQARIEIVALDTYTVPSLPPVPSGGFGLRTQPRPVGAFGPVYDAAEPYPAEIARLSPTYHIRQIEGAGVIVHPVRYLPAAASLEVVRSIQVRIQHESRTPNTTLRYPAPPDSRAFRALAAARFENYSESIAGETNTATVRANGSFTGTDKLLVILPDAWDLAMFDEFLTWKRQRGLSILTARYPADTGSGTAAVANFIRSAYDTEDIAYVILLGDENAIPHGTGSQSSTPSDTIYTLVAGNDDYHDLLLSRVSATTSEKVATILAKSLAYERNPDTVAGWREHVAMIASNEDGSPTGSVYRGKKDYEVMAPLRQRFLDDDRYDLVDPIYQGFAEGSTAQITASWNAGRSLFYYLGHGLVDKWSSVTFTNTDVFALNNGTALPFVVSGACQTGAFQSSSTCLAEAMLWGRQADGVGGAAAVIAATNNMAWDPPIAMLEAFTGYYLGETSFPVGHLQPTGQPLLWDAGGLSFASIQRAMDYCASASSEGTSSLKLLMQQTHLFGDGTLGVRTITPQTLVVSHEDFVHPRDDLAVTVATAGGGPLANATVVLSDDSGNLSAAITDANGQAALSPAPLVAGTLVTLTVYERNAIPYQAEDLPVGDSLVILGPANLSLGFTGEDYTHTFRAALGQEPYAWTLTASNLPPTMTFAADGSLTGTPTATGTYTFTAQVTDHLGDTDELACTWTVAQAVQLADQSLAEATVGTAYEASVVATGTQTPFTYTVLAGSPPPGLTFAADGSLAGTPSRQGNYTLTVQVTDTAGRSDQGLITIAVLPAETVLIETASLADATTGLPYSAQLTASGGSGGGYNWTILAGSLPDGLTLNSVGLISGTATASGTATFTVQVTDDAVPPRTASREFSLAVGAPVAITTVSLPDGVVNIAYNRPIQATGSYPPFTFSAVGGEEYELTTAASTFAETGVLQADWTGDEIHHTLDLGFAFPYFGQTYTTCRVGDNGYLVFGNSAPVEGTFGDCWNAIASRLDNYHMIAPFWADLYITPTHPDTGIWLTRENDRITIRWRGRDFDTKTKVLNFAVTLHASGLVVFQYGAIDTQNRVVIGLGDAGEHNSVVVFSKPKNGIAASAWSGADDHRFSPVGILPPGLSLATNGTLSGIPTVEGSFVFTVLAADSRGFTDLANLTVQIHRNNLPDTDGDGNVSNTEILAYIERWHAGEVTETDVEQAVALWQQGPPASRTRAPLVAPPERTRLIVTFGDRATLDRLIDHGLIITSVHGPDAWIDATAEERAWIEGLGLPCVVAPLPADRATPTTYDELVTRLNTLAATYPAICRLEQIGLSVDGRYLLALVISDHPRTDEDEPKPRIVGGIHGDERLSVTIPVRLAEWLLQNYGGTDADGLRATALVDELEIWILPLLNPDGYESNTRANRNGIDLNRNFPDGFVNGIATVYAEGAPDTSGRQPETAAFMAWTAANRFTLGATLHTGAQLVCYPYGNNAAGTSTYSSSPDDALYIDLSQTYVANHPTMSTIINSCAWYRVVGELPDWAYRYTGSIEITVELDTAPAPPEETAWAANREALLAFLEYSRRGIRGTVRDAATGLPLSAAIAIAGNEREVYTNPTVGNYHRLLLPGTYDVTIAAEGYAPQTFTGVAVDGTVAARLDVELEALSPAHSLVREFATLLFLPENENTIHLRAQLDPDNLPHAFIVSETLPDGWTYVPGSAAEQDSGTPLAAARTEGNTVAWLFWRETARDQHFSYRATAPAIRAETALFGGSLTTIDTARTTIGNTLWQAQTENRTILAIPAGWSLLSLPLTPAVNPLPGLVADHQVSVWAWDSAALRYNVPAAFAAMEGYWFHAPAALDLIIEGQPPPTPERDFAPGWNLFGPLDHRPLLQETFLDGNTLEWSGEAYQTATSLHLGMGYWIHATGTGRAALR